MDKTKKVMGEESMTYDISVDIGEETADSEGIVDVQKMKIRNLISGIYGIQKLRIATGNRIVASFNSQMGQQPSTKQDDMDKEVKSMIDRLRSEYDRITDAYIAEKITVNSAIKKMSKESNDEKALQLIKSKLDYDMIDSYMKLLESEEIQVKVLTKEVQEHPMWNAFFKDIKGCGPMMAAVCLAYFDVHKARHVSSFWRYAGLDVVQVYVEDDAEGNPVYHGEGRGRKKNHLEEREYVDKNGEKSTKMGITFNAVLKTKLCGVLGSSFIKTGRGDKYEKIYRDYRARLAQRPDLKATYNADGVENDKNKMKRHGMANRYMIKCFVRDLWVTWRELEGYEVSEPYEVAKLGMKPHMYNEYHERVALSTQKKKNAEA